MYPTEIEKNAGAAPLSETAFEVAAEIVISGLG